jgi:hypothetical protein
MMATHPPASGNHLHRNDELIWINLIRLLRSEVFKRLEPLTDPGCWLRSHFG